MASNEQHNNTTHSIAQRQLRSAVVAATSIMLAASLVQAQPSTLIANPAGSLSIDPQALISPGQNSGNEFTVGPPLETSGAGSEALEPDSAPSPIEMIDSAMTESSASKPLGTQESPVVGDPTSGENHNASNGGWGLRTALALATVIGLILLCKFAFVRMASRGGGSIAAQLGPSGRAPSGLLSVLARYPIAKGSTLVLLRLDRRVLLLSQTGQGFTTLAEIDDPEEVAALIMRAEDEEGASLTRRFRTMLSQAERDPDLIGEHEYEIDSAAPMTPRAATARFHDLAMDENVVEGSDSQDQADAVGSLRNRLRSLREVTA